MNWLRALKQVLGCNEPETARRRYSVRGCLRLEMLESRLVPYSVTGNAWPNPQLITISFVPDGTVVSTSGTSQVGSNLFAAFNNNPRLVNQWQAQILKAAQAWAAQTNINFAVVPDNGAGIGSGIYQQGDPGMGDIRISGYNFGNTALATAMQPPPANNYSIAGDIAFNTGQTFNIGTTYDLYTVAMHEFGHALGMDHSSAGTSAVMYPNYTGVKPGLSSDDIAGIRNIYSSNAPRSVDAYNGANGSFSTASNINSLINTSSLTAVVSNLNLAAASQVEYFTFNAPSGSAGSMTVSVQSSGLSLLAPKVTVYAADQSTVLGSASGLGQYGTTLNVTVNNVTAGKQFYVKVQGADTSMFGTGAYALTLNLGTGPAPAVPKPNTQVAAPANTHGGGGYADSGADGDQLLSAIPTIAGISPDTGASSNDGVTNATRIKMFGTAPVLALPLLNSIQVHQVTYSGGKVASDRVVATVSALLGNWTWDNTATSLPNGTYTYYAEATSLVGGLLGGGTSLPSATFTVVIDTVAPAKPVISGVRETSSPSGQTLGVQGTAEANSTVTVLLNGQAVGTTAADSKGNWNFAYTRSQFASGTYKFTATATDLAGNVSAASSPYNLVLGGGAQNPPPPQLAASSILSVDSTGTVHAVATPTFTGTAKPGTLITIVDGDTILGTVLVGSSGKWSFTSPKLASGTHNIAVFATDSLGNAGLLSSPLTIVV
jgi:predicted Zn-dependent protease